MTIPRLFNGVSMRLIPARVSIFQEQVGLLDRDHGNGRRNTAFPTVAHDLKKDPRCNDLRNASRHDHAFSG